MAAPSITVVDTSDRTVTTWDNGTVQAQNYSAVLSIRVWNNRGGAVTLSDLKDAYSYMRNNIEDYPDKYKMIKDDLKSILIYTLY